MLVLSLGIMLVSEVVTKAEKLSNRAMESCQRSTNTVDPSVGEHKDCCPGQSWETSQATFEGALQLQVWKESCLINECDCPPCHLLAVS